MHLNLLKKESAQRLRALCRFHLRKALFAFVVHESVLHVLLRVVHEIVIFDAVAAVEKVTELEITQIERNGGKDGNCQNRADETEECIADDDANGGDGGTRTKLWTEQSFFQKMSFKDVHEDDERK